MVRIIGKLLVLLILILASSSIYGQNVVVTDDDSYPVDSSAMLDVKSDSKGLLIPRLTTIQRTGITTPATGLLVYDSNLNVFYYYDGSGWVNISKSQVWEVNSGYVYLASETNNVGIGTNTPNSKLEVRADDSFTVDDTLFSVKDKNGNVVFAVFPDGAAVYVNEGTKGKVGGFAVSGRSPSKAGAETDIFIVTPDSTRIFVNDTISVKGKVGGFAVSGRSPSKGIANEYLVVTGDSTRIYINDTSTVKGKVGGFAVSGRSPSKGLTNDYLQVTRDSTRVYITESTTKGKVGGFAVSGRSPSKGIEKEYFNISANAAAEKINNESRIMWYPEKSAFMAGEVHVGSADSVGENSTALGYRNIAMGNWSQAFGFQSQALGNYSTAIGREAEANTNSLAIGSYANAGGVGSYALGDSASSTGDKSFAFGSSALAIADNSFAFGSIGIDSIGNITGNTKATGEFAYAFGLGSVASGRGAFAIGANDTASGDFATALGYKTNSTGWFSTSMGSRTEATSHYSFAIGYATKSSGWGSNALGYMSEATGNYSMSMGYKTKAYNDGAIAFGVDSRADGANSLACGNNAQTGSLATNAVAFGNGTNANGECSMAIGHSTTGTGWYSFSGGHSSIAGGSSSLAFGYTANSTGSYSAAIGYGVISQAHRCFVVGSYNVAQGNLTGWVNTDPIFVVGNGQFSSPRNNALVVYKNGNMKLDGHFYPDNDNAYDLGTSSFRWDDIYATNGVIQTSDLRLKTDINNIKYGINEIMELRPVSFIWKTRPETGIKLGLIAQEVQPIINEVVNVGDDENKTLGIRYSDFVPVLIKAIQEQQAIIDDQKKKNEELEIQLNQVIERLEKLENK